MTRIVLTYREYETLPGDGRRYEIHDGGLSVTLAPSPRHQTTSRNLFRLLDGHVRARGLGEMWYAPFDVILSETSIVPPDIIYAEQSRLGALSQRGLEGPPMLAVEIVSPSTTLIDRVTKPQLYARHGVPYLWLVDPEGRILDAFVLGPEGYSLAVRGAGSQPLALPPFPDLGLIPDALWR